MVQPAMDSAALASLYGQLSTTGSKEVTTLFEQFNKTDSVQKKEQIAAKLATLIRLEQKPVESGSTVKKFEISKKGMLPITIHLLALRARTR
jgi:hypothetical protein